MINFYRDVFRARSHILSPLNKFAAATTKKRNSTKRPIPFVILKKHLVAFDIAKEMNKTEVMLAFPDFTKPFHLYTDVSDIQLGAIVQDGKPLGFYTRKLSGSQLSYTVGEK